MSDPPGDVVSFDDELLIVVDENDQVLGHRTKAECHDGEGILHRAFSVFLFDDSGRLLLQQRSADKRLWAGFWSNSCCSHPRQGETDIEAAGRRIHEELGVTSDLSPLFRFRYHAPFGDLGAEHEFCSVFLGQTGEAVTVNEREIADWRWDEIPAFERSLAEQPELYTPWLKLEWERMRADHWPAVQAICGSRAEE